MILKNNKWYVSYFFWCCNVMDRFTFTAHHSGTRANRYRNNANLCQFFRTLLIGSLIALLSVSLEVWAFFVFFVLPFIVVGVHSVTMFVLAVLAIFTMIAALVGVIWGLLTLTDKITDALDRRAMRQTEPSLFGLLCIYIKAVKERYCPTISFKEDNQ